MRFPFSLKPAIFLVAISGLAAPPVLQELSPRGGQRGKTFTLYLRGDGLTANAEIRSTLPAIFSRMTLSRDPLSDFAMARPGSVLPFLVTLKADAPAGFYPVRVTTPEGVSNVLLFTVGDLPETEEAEMREPKRSNNFPEEAQAIAIPAVVNGTLTRADIDTYKFTAKAGQKLVIEVEARRAGSAVDPAIEVLDAAGKEIARNDDAPGLGVDTRLDLAVTKTGEYRVQVHDSKYSEQGQNFYRLKIGSYSYAEAMFPLGWRRGQPVDVTLSGGNLDTPVKVRPDVDAKSGFVPVRVPGSSAAPFQFVLGDRPEVLEPPEGGGALVADTVVNGRISKPGEVDRYKLRVQPGEKWMFEVQAAALGTSELDGLLTVYDGAGKKLAAGDDLNTPDPVLAFTVPKGVEEITLALEDVLGRGGEIYGYRLEAHRQAPDFVADLATPFVNVPAGGTAQVVVIVQRRGYDGALEVKIPDLPEGIHVAGGHVPPEAAAQSFNNDNAGRRTARCVLTLTSDAEAKPLLRELQVIAEAETPAGPIRRVARNPVMITAVRGAKEKAFTAPWLGGPLMLATTSALPFTIDTPVYLVRIAQGFEFEVKYQVKRRAGFQAPVRVREEIAGAVGNLRILKGEAGKNRDQGSLLIATNFATPITKFDFILQGAADVDGKQITIGGPALEIDIAAGYDVHLSQSAVEAAAGSRFALAGWIRREPTFEGGLVKLEAQDLPDHVTCTPAEIAAGGREFILDCEAATGVKPGSFEIRIASSAPETGRKAKAEYKIADVPAKLTITGAKQARN